jgi:molybdate-binding protein
MKDDDLIQNAVFSCFTRKQEELVYSIRTFHKEKGFISPKQKKALQSIIDMHAKRELFK